MSLTTCGMRATTKLRAKSTPSSISSGSYHTRGEQTTVEIPSLNLMGTPEESFVSGGHLYFDDKQRRPTTTTVAYHDRQEHYFVVEFHRQR
jgi:hypothetical protein